MNHATAHNLSSLAAAILLFGIIAGAAPAQTSATQQTLPVEFSGGHETDPRDHGRPVVLVAGALGVQPEDFREAFSHVHPAPPGKEPEPEQVRENKAALMSALGKYGVTNERLDQVSNYYRYRRERGQMWPTSPAKAYANVRDGKVVSIVVTTGGSGYSSPPSVHVPGARLTAATAELQFSANFEQNGMIKGIKLE